MFGLQRLMKVIAGKNYLAQIDNLRCRIAGYAYIARFEGVLESLQRDDYRLKADYHQPLRLASSLKIFWTTLLLCLKLRRPQSESIAASANG